MKNIILAGAVALIALHTHSVAAQADADTFWAGGVGISERAAAPGGNVKIVLARNTGPYLADLEVVIADEDGQVVNQLRSSGPWVIGTLPAGRYKVTARRTVTGEWQSAWFFVNNDASSQTLHLAFEQADRLD